MVRDTHVPALVLLPSKHGGAREEPVPIGGTSPAPRGVRSVGFRASPLDAHPRTIAIQPGRPLRRVGPGATRSSRRETPARSARQRASSRRTTPSVSDALDPAGGGREALVPNLDRTRTDGCCGSSTGDAPRSRGAPAPPSCLGLRIFSSQKPN